jgi:PIN domain nuclease of toxin-antitoxin system
MRLLLDTHVLLSLADDNIAALPREAQEALSSPRNSVFQSVASLWEAAIKHRLGKLPLPCPIEEWPTVLEQLGVATVEVVTEHVIAEVNPWPDTRDPFDRLLLAVAQVEGMRLLTFDDRLRTHPLAWRASSA